MYASSQSWSRSRPNPQPPRPRLAARVRSKHRTRTFAWLVSLFLLLQPTRLRAEGVADEAELQFQLGTERYLAREYRPALEHFLASNRLVPNRNVIYNVARCFEQLARFADAHRWYLDAIDGEFDPKVRKSIEGAIARVSPQVAVIDVKTMPLGAAIYIDRLNLGARGIAPRALAVAPGKYHVIATLPGYEPAESEMVEAKLGRAVSVALELKPIVGSVRIEGDDDVEVRADDESGAPDCVTPCELRLPAGAHTLYLARSGFQSVVRHVSLAERATVVVRAQLAAVTGSLMIDSDERGALVEIDGRAAGYTPVVVAAVPIGLRRVRVTLPGFATIEREIDVRANQQATLDDLTLEPLREVTAASRRTERIEDAPSSVTIIPPQELKAFAYPTIAEALRGVRGFSLSNDGVYSSVNVRGLGQPNDYGNRLLVLSDGMVLNDDIVSSSFIGFDGRTDLGDVERIEVIRGAGSVLYGTGAISGVVNLVTRPRESGNSAHAALSTVDNGVGRVRGGFHMNYENAGAWASFALARSEGRALALSAPDVRTASTASGVDAFNSGTTMGRVWWGDLTAQWLYTARDLSTPHGVFGTDFNDPRNRSRDKRGMFELRYEPKLKDIGEVLVRVHANLSTFDGAFVYEPETNVERQRGGWLGIEARFVTEPLARPELLRLSVGMTAERHLQVKLFGETIEGDARSSYLDENKPYTLGAAYVLAESVLNDWLRVSAGTRLDVYSTFGASLNPRLSVILKPTKAGVLKIFGGRAFRAPSPYELYYNDAGTTQIASAALDPEVSYSGEVEYSHRLFRDWTVLGALHATYLEGIIETRGSGTPESPLQYANSDVPALTAGAEIEARREWRQGWTAAVSYGLQRAQYLERPEGGSAGDRSLINAPRHLLSLKGSLPIVPGIAQLAARAAIEGPRRVRLQDASTTKPAVIADVVITGDVQRFNLDWSLGFYNVLNWSQEVPVTEGGMAPTLCQNGRTLLLQLGLTI